MRNSERALLVISDLSSGSNLNDAFKSLYKFLESSGIILAETLGLLYGNITILRDREATSTNFVNALSELAKSPVKEVDVLLHLHGLNNKLIFHNKESVNTSTLADKIAALNIGKRLRMLYSTACFGASHAQHFIRAGFTCASGSRCINANSPIEYPIFISMWASGVKFTDCINSAENLTASSALDALASLNFPGKRVDSNKDIFGKGHATINSI